MKKNILLISSLFLFFFVSCAYKSDSNESKVSIGLSISTLNNPFFVSLSDGAQRKAKELNINLNIANASDDISKQANDIANFISNKVQVLIINPVDSLAIASAVSYAINAGIKVIALDRIISGIDVDCEIVSDNIMGAELATKYLLELVGSGALVAELIGIPGASATMDRGKGFHNIADLNLKVVASYPANFNRAEGLLVMKNILKTNPNIKGIFAHNDEMALGALEAVKSSGKDIAIVGFDATEEALLAVKDGLIKATVAQQPELMGAIAVETAFKIVNGESIEKKIPVDVTLVK